MELSSPSKQFEDLIKRILEVNAFRVSKFNSPRNIGGFDFIGDTADEKWAIEVKFYRTARAQASLVESAAARLVHRDISAQDWKGMLIVSSVISPALKLALEEKYGLVFIDRFDLFSWAASSPMLADELSSLLEVSPSESTTQKAGAPSLNSSSRRRETVPPEDTVGTDLCEELHALARGITAWKAYEELCDRILRYLFPNDLLGWHKQQRTDDGLNRFDYICRIRPSTEFWNFLIDHLNSRYVLFEFKNYRPAIKQGQILTTEKYLLEKGLRRVAIIFTRTGADKHAIAMTQGAMREHGKLMLVIDDEKVCEMLHMKERGEDPTDCLFELVDNFLLSLPR
ncbi:restriction endonuclease [Variovorax sp. RCC_210]|uniref:restriction endonuclease n=1 Tax=Variovorax sp. RCC_210 TaxID=3239217 RepID=UPI00352407F2